MRPVSWAHGDLDAVSGAELSHEAGEVGFDGAWVM